jgi:parallel beta-helix repeat protein
MGDGITEVHYQLVRKNVVQNNMEHGIDADGWSGSMITKNVVKGNGYSDNVIFFDLADDASPDDIWDKNKYDTISF